VVSGLHGAGCPAFPGSPVVRNPTSPVLPRLDAAVLRERLASLCLALGANRVGLARRLPVATPGPGPFEVLDTVDAAAASVEEAVPLAAFLELLRGGRGLDVTPGNDDRLARWLRERGERRLLGFPLPSDQRPSVLMVAIYSRDRRVGEQRLEVARAGMDALARALAPPPWVPLAPVLDPPESQDPGSEPAVSQLLSDVVPLPDAIALVERVMLQRALRVSEGNKAAAARRLRLSRQGLYKKLRQHGML